MTPVETQKLVDKLKAILDEVPANYTGRLVLGINFQSGGMHNTIRVTKDVTVVPALGTVNA
jgi:hypothetical protein